MISPAVWSAIEQNAWSPPPALTVSRHADAVRYVPYGAEPGPWKTDRAPYTRAIMDAYGDPEVEKITILGPAQAGKTEAVFNMLHYTIDLDPVPSMYVIAIDGEIPTISTDRILRNLEASEQLATHLTGKSWDIKQSAFRFDRMPLYFTGAGSASALASKAIGRLFLDEVDKYDDFVGNEGHPAKLAERRGTTFGDFKVVYLCTPTRSDGFIVVSWSKSNRMKYHVPCPLCDGFQVLQFGRLKPNHPEAQDPDAILSGGVYYECQHCGGKIDSGRQPYLIAHGVWVPQGCGVDSSGRLTGQAERSRRHCGFWITELLSPWLDWAKMLAEWTEIQAAGLEKQGMIKEFTNQVLGGPFDDAGEKINPVNVKKQVVSIAPRAVPLEAKLLISAADYHKSHRGNERIDYGVMAISPGFKAHLVLVESVHSLDEYYRRVLASPFPWAGETDAEELSVVTAFVDSGYEADTVADWCRKFLGVAWPIKGMMKMREPFRRAPMDEVMDKAKNPQRRKKAARFKGLDLIEINTGYFKDLASNLMTPDNERDRALTFNESTPQWFFDEITNEHRVQRRVGRSYEYVWEPVRRGLPTHGLDILVYLLAAAYFNKGHLMRDEQQERQIPAAVAARQKNRFQRRVGTIQR